MENKDNSEFEKLLLEGKKGLSFWLFYTVCIFFVLGVLGFAIFVVSSAISGHFFTLKTAPESTLFLFCFTYALYLIYNLIHLVIDLSNQKLKIFNDFVLIDKTKIMFSEIQKAEYHLDKRNSWSSFVLTLPHNRIERFATSLWANKKEITQFMKQKLANKMQ